MRPRRRRTARRCARSLARRISRSRTNSSSELRPEAARILDEAIKALQDNPQLKIEIEGHTCNIGTAEYNLALGERRATAVRDYLISRGITSDRLRTVSYGEERPKYDNSREETRRLNRSAALVVRVTQ